MSTDLIEKFKYLPDEIIHIIINYTNVLSYRNGKYINKLRQTDCRYKLVNQISRKIMVGHNYGTKLANNNDYGYFFVYNFDNNNITLLLKYFDNKKPGVYNIISTNKYIYNVNGKWSKLVNYIM